MVAVKSNAAKVAKSIEAVRGRLANLEPAMKAASNQLDRAFRVAVRESTSPSGVRWPDLADSTIERRKRAGKSRDGLKPLRGDTGAMLGQMFVQPTKTGIRFGSNARSAGGFPYFLSHQFGAPSRNVPQRAFFPVDSVAGKLVPMSGGPADRFFESLRKISTRYILRGK